MNHRHFFIAAVGLATACSRPGTNDQAFQWTNQLPEDCRDLADEKLVAAAAAGMSLRDLAELFGEIYEQCRSASPDEDKDEVFDDRAVRLITTF